MSFVYARVDSRLIHGQTGAKLVRQLGVSRIILVDDKIAKDDFLKEIYQISAQAISAGVEIYSVEQIVTAYEEGRFETGSNMLIFGSIEIAYRALEAGLKYEELAIGSIKSNSPDMKFASKYVYISKEDAVMLRKIEEEIKSVYFQLMPGEGRQISIDEGIKKAGF